jgi:hypothetical protein
VQVPNSDASLSFQTHQIDEIFLNSTVQSEVLVYTMSGATNGTFNLRIYRPTANPVYDVNVDITYGCSASTFTNALNKFDIFSPYSTSTVMTMYKGSVVTTNLSEATSITYTVSVYQFRPSTVTSQKFIYTQNTYNGVFTQPTAALQTHSPIISGTFTLSIGGVLIDPNGNGTIYYNAYAGDLQAYIQNINGLEHVEVSKGYQISCDYSCSWYIKYKGYNSIAPVVVANPLGLSGGTSIPSITVNTRRNFSTNVLFHPVDYRFLNVPAKSPNVIVSTNGVPSICTGSCSYAVSLYSEVSWLSHSGNILSFGITDPQSIGFTASQISIFVQGLPCSSPSGSITNFTCQLPTNADNSSALVASSNNIPQVWVGNYGLAALTANATPFDIPLVVNPLNVSTGGTNGGYVITISGNGFPSDKSQISITLCNALATIKSTAST